MLKEIFQVVVVLITETSAVGFSVSPSFLEKHEPLTDRMRACSKTGSFSMSALPYALTFCLASEEYKQVLEGWLDPNDMDWSCFLYTNQGLTSSVEQMDNTSELEKTGRNGTLATENLFETFWPCDYLHQLAQDDISEIFRVLHGYFGEQYSWYVRMLQLQVPPNGPPTEPVKENTMEQTRRISTDIASFLATMGVIMTMLGLIDVFLRREALTTADIVSGAICWVKLLYAIGMVGVTWWTPTEVPSQQIYCSLWGFVNEFCTITTAMLFAVISCDRCYVVVFPFGGFLGKRPKNQMFVVKYCIIVFFLGFMLGSPRLFLTVATPAYTGANGAFIWLGMGPTTSGGMNLVQVTVILIVLTAVAAATCSNYKTISMLLGSIKNEAYSGSAKEWRNLRQATIKLGWIQCMFFVLYFPTGVFSLLVSTLLLGNVAITVLNNVAGLCLLIDVCVSPLLLLPLVFVRSTVRNIMNYVLEKMRPPRQEARQELKLTPISTHRPVSSCAPASCTVRHRRSDAL